LGVGVLVAAGLAAVMEGGGVLVPVELAVVGGDDWVQDVSSRKRRQSRYVRIVWGEINGTFVLFCFAACAMANSLGSALARN